MDFRWICGDKIAWFFSVILQGVCRADRVGCGYSGSGSSVSACFYHNIRGEMILGNRRFRIGVVSLEELLDVLDCVNFGIEDF